MQLQISKWGNSLALRLPASIAKKLHIQVGDSIELTLNSQSEIVLTPSKVFDKAAFLQNLNTINQQIPKTDSVIDLMRHNERY